MRDIVSRNARATERTAGVLLKRLLKEKPLPLVFALTGELGSGKTTFVRGLAGALSIREQPKSSTFVLVKWYELPRKFRPARHFIHVDAYRLERAAEAKHLGLGNILRNRDSIVVVEWADRMKKFIPRCAIWVHFTHGKSPHERVIQCRM